LKPSQEEIDAMQGTRKSERAPWETYGEQMDNDPDITPELQKQIDEYSKNYHDTSSEQNKEELARWQEQNQDIAKEYQWVSPEEYADEGARVGTPMHSSVFVSKLQSLGIRCWYTPHPQPRKLTLIYTQKGMDAQVGCWVQSGFMPELSIMSFDDHGVPLAEKFRGWRTPLLQLILKHVITEKQADELFGPPKTTPAFHRYNQTLQSFRNVGGRI
jgi:hypothetical protein